MVFIRICLPTNNARCINVLPMKRNSLGQFLPSPVFQRWADKVERLDSGCWRWKASCDKDGYGQFFPRHGYCVRAHAFAFEHFRFPITTGLQFDHLCRNTWCVNPFHLEPVTTQVNNLRSNSPSAINARKTHCKFGHQFTPENTAIIPKGRSCKHCKRNRWRISHGWNITMSFQDAAQPLLPLPSS